MQNSGYTKKAPIMIPSPFEPREGPVQLTHRPIFGYSNTDAGDSSIIEMEKCADRALLSWWTKAPKTSILKEKLIA